MQQVDPAKFRLGLIGPLPPPFGGMANQTRQLQRLLQAEGIDVVLVQTNADYPWVWVADIKGLRAVFRLVPYLVNLWRLAGRVDCMHVMANSGWSWQLYAAPAVWMGWIKSVPVIINYRGGEAEQYFRQSFKWVAPTLRKVTAIVVPSVFLAQVFSAYGFQAEIIPNIIDLKKFAFRYRRGVADPDAPLLVITRNLEKIYGLDIAIDAIRLLKSRLPRIKVYIAGSGPLLGHLMERVQQLALTENIEFTGKLTPEQVVALYGKADIMLNPTTVDNMPNSILEALANGLPVVTTNVGGIPYMVTDNQTALFVDVNDPEMLAAKIEQLVDNRDLYEKLVSNGFEQAKKYGWESVRHQWLGLYKRVTE